MQPSQTRSGPPAPPSFRVRPARRGDAEAIGRLLEELGYPGAADTNTCNWVISHPEMEILIAGDSLDRAIGVLTLSHRPQLRIKGRIATIDELVVTAAWRRKGVGRALVQKALERARVLGVKRLEVVTHRGRSEYLKDFYGAVGFGEADCQVLRLGEPAR